MRLLGLLLVLCVASQAHAARVFVQVEPAQLEVGQTGQLTVFMVDGRSRGAPQFELPTGLSASFDGSYQQFRQEGFDRTMVYGYRYRITALEVGSYRLGPWSFTLRDGNPVETEAVGLRVVPQQEDGDAHDLLIASGFNTEEAWEGQVVVYQYRSTARIPVGGVDWRLPAFEGLRVPANGKPEAYEYVVDDVDQRRITVEGGAVPLIATGRGGLEHSPALATVRVLDDRPSILGMRRYRSERVLAEPSSLTVRPLPDPPDGFSGLVGEFEFRSRLGQRRASVGASVQWDLEVIGDGVVEGWNPPPLPEGVAAVVYDNDAKVTAKVTDGSFAMRATFERVMVPTEPGVLELAPQRIITWSPRQQTYITHEVALGRVTVTAGREMATQLESFAEEADAPISEQEAIDFRGNYTWGMASRPPVQRAVPWLTGVAASPALFIGLLALGRRVRSWRRERRERTEVPPTWSEQLTQAPGPSLERLAWMDVCLRGALADRVGVAPAALDRSHATGTLPDPLQQRVRALFDALDRARYADGGVPEDLLDETRDVVRLLEAG